MGGRPGRIGDVSGRGEHHERLASEGGQRLGLGEQSRQCAGFGGDVACAAGLLANAWPAAGSGRADQKEVGSSRPVPRRARLGSSATALGGPVWADGVPVAPYGGVVSSRTIPATCSGWRAA
jgi:hypothetical protein